MGQPLLHYINTYEDNNALGIPTFNSIIKASIGDYIIRDELNDYYSCKPDIFKVTYDEI
ncbi:hypothetical protein [Clostridium sp.]|uniref:hypothetical protein n=1 Tax=Clostridium sp. TaxID=1506 RepID=UPI002FCBFE57